MTYQEIMNEIHLVAPAFGDVVRLNSKQIGVVVEVINGYVYMVICEEGSRVPALSLSSPEAYARNMNGKCIVSLPSPLGVPIHEVFAVPESEADRATRERKGDIT